MAAGGRGRVGLKAAHLVFTDVQLWWGWGVELPTGLRETSQCSDARIRPLLGFPTLLNGLQNTMSEREIETFVHKVNNWWAVLSSALWLSVSISHIFTMFNLINYVVGAFWNLAKSRWQLWWPGLLDLITRRVSCHLAIVTLPLVSYCHSGKHKQINTNQPPFTGTCLSPADCRLIVSRYLVYADIWNLESFVVVRLIK